MSYKSDLTGSSRRGQLNERAHCMWNRRYKSYRIKPLIPTPFILVHPSYSGRHVPSPQPVFTLYRIEPDLFTVYSGLFEFQTKDLDGIFQTQFRHNVHSHQLSHQLTLRDPFVPPAQIPSESREQDRIRNQEEGGEEERRRRRKDSPPGSTTWQHKESSI